MVVFLRWGEKQDKPAGNWFAYWLRLDALQRTHLALLATAMLGMILMSV